MKQISVQTITEVVAKLCIDSNCNIPQDIKYALKKSEATESEGISKEILSMLIKNSEIAQTERLPICQDTGMTVVFVEIGQEVQITGGNLTNAINEGVAKGYKEGYLRKSIVADPIHRINTNDNTPAIIHYNIVEGSNLYITIAPKGFGSENMSAIKMLKPSDGIEGVKSFVLQTVKSAGSNPCPPIIVGVGVGGTMEKAAIIAKQALLRDIGTNNENPYWASIETELLSEINKLNIGPSGLGGKTTALALHINTFATHIAGLPVAVNIGCHATRHASIIL